MKYHLIVLIVLIISALVVFLLLYCFQLDLLIIYLVMINLVTFLIYGLDKYAAIHGWQRAPENLLHVLAFSGGSPAALLAQKIFNHKTSKRSFQIIYWAIVAVQAGMILFFVSR
ncbi:MAG: DUF1294 domain-containing protein [Campylobacterota bacterium]|nr:DUF1294 domain-containing protein [Campylobacterota bacterium]